MLNSIAFGFIFGLFSFGAAQISVTINDCHIVMNPYKEVGGTCHVGCEVTNLDDQHYIAIQKTVRYYSYDRSKSLPPHDIYTTERKFVDEINKTGRYHETILDSGVRIRFQSAEAGDSGYYHCEVRRKTDNQVVAKSEETTTVIADVFPDVPFRIKFGLRRPDTRDANLVVEEVFENDANINLNAEDFENLVYIVNMTDIQVKTPTYKLVSIEDRTEKALEFEDRYHVIEGADKKLIPHHPKDVTYLYQPKGSCSGSMRLQGYYFVDYYRKRDVNLHIECNSGISTAMAPFSFTSMIGAVLFVKVA